ncbi:hypothetical protein [Candidatus Nitrospira neomarina]|uniref:Enolase n=1 Tax=Candidatus Nitrospira neomarina TaxID=3020899 RepID=A0AA96GJK9_9BACT|nr:hypothetical protein [Candidatus Nitrospira neomarina]WNM63141.1 hypothetical protein PQG83_05140 [Candidatus Nitrospira neomarina]
MKDLCVRQLRFRGILESRGVPTVEAELDFVCGSSGVASAPIAIKPGRMEKIHLRISELGDLDDIPEFANLRRVIEGREFFNQQVFDTYLESLEIFQLLGANVKMALSIAFCRATAEANGLTIVDHIARVSGSRPAMPRLLANVYSGGIHDRSGGLPFQQIMFVPDDTDLKTCIEAVLRVFNSVEREVVENFVSTGLSASSGLIVEGALTNQLLDVLVKIVEQEIGNSPITFIGLDVAGEHLREANGYRLKDELVSPEALLDLHLQCFANYPIVYFEDPFDPEDILQWRQLIRDKPSFVKIFGDDLFVTDGTRIDPELADGIVLKVNQNGTLSGALLAAKKARALGLDLCVSHRSGETEDCFICDLAVALGAAFVKIGGPRRGDRVAKYNRLLRLWETLKK